MGCCQSSEDNNNSPYPQAPAPADPHNRDASLPRDSSRAAINQSARDLQQQHQHRQHRQHAAPTASRIPPNQPIRPPSPIYRSPKGVSNMHPPWTRSHLEKQRKEFFETRVTGHAETWGALQLVCESLRDNDMEQAQTIMNAAHITCPNGRVARGRGSNRHRGGVYDEKGVLYDIPDWVLQNPKDIVEEEREDDEEWKLGLEFEDEAADKVTGPQSKGKARAEDAGDEMRLTARLSDKGSDVVVKVGSKELVKVAVQKIREQVGGKRVKLLFMGREMPESRTLAQCGWQPGQVVNAFVYEGDEAIIRSKMRG